MIFAFDARTREQAGRIVRYLRAMAPRRDMDLGKEDADLFRRLVRLPPHLLSLEDMLFCQDVVQRIANQNFPGTTVSLARDIGLADRDGLRVYWIPSSWADKVLRF